MGVPRPPITVVWHKCTDLRVHDHLPLQAAHRQPYPVLHLFVFDPFWFKPLPITRLPKTGPLRAKFLQQAVEDLRRSLQQRGSDLAVRHSPAVAVFVALRQQYDVRAVYAYREVCSQEVKIERAVEAAVRPAPLVLEWGFTLYHRDDLPAELLRRFPRSYTGFRKVVQEQCTVRPPVGMEPDAPPMRFRSPPKDVDSGAVPSLAALGLSEPEIDPRSACVFTGGETTGMARVQEYFWDTDHLRRYVGATNTMTPGKSAIAPLSTTKLSPWLAHGCISPQWLHHDLESYERRRVQNKATGWLKHELVWRDYLRFGGLAECWGDEIFKVHGIHGELTTHLWHQDFDQFRKWAEGRTGFPFVDCFMKELAATGYTTHCGRECVAWFLVRDLATPAGWLDWRMGAEYFEHILIDFEPTANWGNWAYRIATTTPSGGLDFDKTRSIEMLLWAYAHDPQAAWVKRWLPALRPLPAVLALEPWRLATPEAEGHLDPPDGRQWPCPACTFLNPPKASRCGMCRVAPRPVSFRGFRYGVDYPFPCIKPQCPRQCTVDFSEPPSPPDPASPLSANSGGGGLSDGDGATPGSDGVASPAPAGPPPARTALRSRQRNRLQTDR